MTLRDMLGWPKSRYDSKIDNVTTEFFIPALKESTTYQRIGGFFSSTSLSLAARGIKELIQNDGKMQLVISPILTKEDAEMLNKSQEQIDILVDRVLVKKFDIETEFEKNHVAALAYLLKKESLEIKVDIPTNTDGGYLDYDTAIQKNMLEEKLGIFQDRDGNAVSFRGPVNENKQSWERGIFSITVDVGWIDGQRLHVQDDADRFAKKWSSSDLIDLPQHTRENILLEAPDNMSEIDLDKFNVPAWAMLPNGKILWNHQIRAVNSWIGAGYRGILSMATSGGKTLAALVSSSLVSSNSLVLVLVPTSVLLEQWEKEIRQFYPAVDLVPCSSDHPKWPVILSGKLVSYVEGNPNRDKQIIVLSTMSTAVGDRFRKCFEHIKKEFITVIADEVHHLGASEFSKIFSIDAQQRLGLSATYVRDWDEIGTNRIREYFGPQLDAEYTISDGINDKKLSKYKYHPFFAYLNESEYDGYAEHSVDIRKIYAMLQNIKDQSKKQELMKKYEKLLLDRAEIIKKAKDKLRTYSQILLSSPPKPYIVFADDNQQVNELKKIHKNTIQEINQNSTDEFEKDDIMTFSGKLNRIDKAMILEEAKNKKTPLFAMYCLDEGVDVPEFQSAILVSSSTSKRQYIQRRGRILRTSKQKIAHLYDIIILPNHNSYPVNADDAESIIKKENERVRELAQDAINKWDAIGIFEKKIKDLRLK